MGILWAHSGQIERDADDNRAVAATAEFFVGATTTPLVVYEDAIEGTAHEDPVESDGNGRWPAVFIPFCTSYDVRVKTAGGTQLYYYREIPNPDPVEASVDSVGADELIQTGDIIFSPATGTRAGFVRCNGRTLGSATSGATERANADTSDLYEFLWNNFSNSILAVTTGRGGSAAADFAANKAIALFDGRGAGLRGVDDMGASAASALTLATFTTGNATTGGSIAGVNTHTLTEAQLAAHTHTTTVGNQSANHTHGGTTLNQSVGHTHTYGGTTSGVSANHTHNVPNVTMQGAGASFAGGSPFQQSGTATTSTESADHTHTYSGTTDGMSASHTHEFTSGTESATHNHTVTNASTGSDTAHNNVPKSILGNLFQKL